MQLETQQRLQHMQARLLKLEQVKELTALSRPSIYRLMAAGKFPRLLKVTARASRWREDQIREWIEQRTAASGQALDSRAASTASTSAGSPLPPLWAAG